MSDAPRGHEVDGLEVRLEQAPAFPVSTRVTPLLEPQSEVLLIGSNMTREPMLVRPVLRFLRGGFAQPSLPAGPQLVAPGQSVAFRVTLPSRPAAAIGIQEVVARKGLTGSRVRISRTVLAPGGGGSWHPFDLEDVGWITVGALFYAFALRGLTQLTYDLGAPALWFVVAAAVAVVVLYATLTHFYKRLMVWSREGVPASSSAARAGELVIMSCLVTYLAVAASSLLLTYGLVEAAPRPLNGVEAVEGLERHFGLSLLGAIPSLRVPETFDLEAPVQYHGLAMGLVVTVYRLALLLPAAALVVSLFNDVRFWPTRAGQADVVPPADTEPGDIPTTPIE